MKLCVSNVQLQTLENYLPNKKPKQPAPPTASAEPVKVRINSKPFGITVQIDGKATCETPGCNLDLLPGKHVLLFKDGDQEVRHTIDVKSGGKALWVYSRMDQSVN